MAERGLENHPILRDFTAKLDGNILLEQVDFDLQCEIESLRKAASQLGAEADYSGALQLKIRADVLEQYRMQTLWRSVEVVDRAMVYGNTLVEA